MAKRQDLGKSLEEMRQYKEELRDMLPDEEEYKDDIIIKRACEKPAELSIESMIGVCPMIVSYDKLGTPMDESSIFDLLRKKSVIEPH